ncbi:MAG: TonB-dependent receptor [Saprospiraceae bacterium]
MGRTTTATNGATALFRPKAGLSYTPSPTLKYYISFAIGHHEPNRDDYTESSAASHPLPEGLYNTEAGWEWNGKSASLGINLYHMFYRNQLVLNGQINDVGAYTRVNVAKSYRAGIEIQNRWVGWNSLEVLTNITFSQNRIKAFTDYVDDWDQGGQEAINYRQTPIAFSPAWVNNQQIRYYLWGHPDSDHFGSIQWGWNHVSRQYLDNTGIKSASIPGYWINDLGLMGRIPLPDGPQITWNLQVQNLWNNFYSSNGWVYRFYSSGYDPRPDDPYARLEQGSQYHLAGYYPQSTRNFLATVTLRW